MPDIIALVSHGVLRARLRVALGPRYRLILLADAPELWRAARTHPAAVLVVEANGATAPDAAAVIHAFRAEYPLTPVVAYCGVAPGVAAAILDLVRAGVHDVVLAGVDDERAAFETVVVRALHRSTADDVLARLAAPGHPAASTILRTFLNAATRPLDVERAAAVLGVHRRTLVKRCAAAALPPPRTLAGWCRLLVAARLLDAGGLTVEQVAHALGFPSANALRNLCHRHARVSLTDLRTRGGYTWLRGQVVDQLAPAPARAAAWPALG